MFPVASSQPKIPIKAPRIVRKARRMQKQRDQQIKTIFDDISTIAKQEVERVQDIAQELLDNPTENPIIIEKNYDEESDDE